MNAASYPARADPISVQLREFAKSHGALGPGDHDDVWDGLRRKGLAAPGLAFAAWAETMALLGGLLTPILTNCPDLATMLSDLERFHPLFDRDRIVVTLHSTSTSIELQAPHGGPADPNTVDACFALVCRLATRLAGVGAHPVMVRLRRPQPPPPVAEMYQKVLGAVAYGQPADRCVFTAATLAGPIADADPVIRSILRPYAERRTDERARPWSAAVREILAGGPRPTASSSRPTAGSSHRLADVARTLLVSPRTLQLRLAGEGQTFAGLLHAAQYDDAIALLAQPGLTVTEIAAAVGFATPSAFARAIRRQTGLTPTQYRASRNQA